MGNVNKQPVTALRLCINNQHKEWFNEKFSLNLILHDRKSISDEEYNSCFNLIKENLQKAYEESSWGWDPVAKRAEIGEPGTKYLLLSPQDRTSTSRDNFGFLSCQIVVEDDEPVIYCYELQLSQGLRGRGLGSRLMAVMHELGRECGLQKAFLTVFTSNRLAFAFYLKLGYNVDQISPKDKDLRGRVITSDYRILSKRLVEC